MKKVLVLLLTASSVAAFADDTSSSAGGNNLYVGVGAGAGWNNAASPATSFRLDGGYNFNEYFAVELGATGITQAGGAINQGSTFYDASVKGTLPLSDMFALVGQLGGAYANPGVATGNGLTIGNGQAGWDFLTAAGVQMNLTRQVSLNLMDYYYYGAPNPDGNTNVVLAGIKYNF